jgi:hypothetical protein
MDSFSSLPVSVKEMDAAWGSRLLLPDVLPKDMWLDSGQISFHLPRFRLPIEQTALLLIAAS